MQLKFKPCLKCFTLTIKGWDYASCVPKIPILRYKAACQKTEKGSAKINTITLLLRPPCPHIHTSREIKKKYLKRKGPRLIVLISLSLILEMKYNLTRSIITLVIPPFKHRVLYRIEFTFYFFFHDKRDFFFVCLFVCSYPLYTKFAHIWMSNVAIFLSVSSYLKFEWPDMGNPER